MFKCFHIHLSPSSKAVYGPCWGPEPSLSEVSSSHLTSLLLWCQWQAIHNFKPPFWKPCVRAWDRGPYMYTISATIAASVLVKRSLLQLPFSWWHHLLFSQRHSKTIESLRWMYKRWMVSVDVKKLSRDSSKGKRTRWIVNVFNA